MGELMGEGACECGCCAGGGARTEALLWAPVSFNRTLERPGTVFRDAGQTEKVSVGSLGCLLCKMGPFPARQLTE